MKFKVTHWVEYDAQLRRRGSLTDGVVDGWRPFCSNLAIEAALLLRLAFHPPLRQIEELTG